MNEKLTSEIRRTNDHADVVEHSDRSAEFAISPQLACHYEPRDAALWSQWVPTGVPCFSIEMLRDLERASHMIEGHFSDAGEKRPLDYIVLRSGIPGVFSVGGDLGYFQQLIIAQDRERLTEYARTAINVQYRNFTAHNLRGVTTIALLEGDALGGGFESALSCNLVIAERHVKAGFPEVLFNMFPGMGGISFLTRRVGRSVADELIRTGRQYTADELLNLGVIDQIVDTGEGASAVRKLIRRREHQKIAHDAMNVVDRLIRPVTLQELNEVVTLWVDCALKLSPRGLDWMQRLYQRQVAIFGNRPAATADEDRGAHLRIAAAA